MGGAAAASMVGGFGEVEEMVLVISQIQKGAAVIGGGALRKHQPRELTGEVGRGCGS